MKKLILSFLAFFIINTVVFSQCDTSRYWSPIFDSVTVLKDVKYGSAEKWSVPYDDMDLLMDIYFPEGDSLHYRPLMIWAHPGGFLTGSKDADATVALCDSFARRGYVTASLKYRLGFNPTSQNSVERAVYRAVQDARAAIRYLKENFQQYGIDTNYTFIGGASAGAFMAIQVVYMDQDEAPESIGSGFGYPALGCLDCSGNSYKHNMDILGYVDLWGAIGDSTWIDANETAKGLLIHGTADGIVPYDVGHPFGVPTTPKTHGSRSIHNQLDSLQIPHTTYFVEGKDHGLYGGSNGNWSPEDPPSPYYDTIFDLVNSHYYKLLKTKADTFSINGKTIVCPKDTLIYTLNAPSNYSVCWTVSNGTIVSNTGNSIQVVFPGSASKATVIAKQFSEIGLYSGTTTFDVTVSPMPTVNFTTSITGLTVDFSPLPQQFQFFEWNFGDGSTSGVKFPTHKYNAQGTYIVSLKATQTGGCSAYYSESVKVETLSNIAEKMEKLNVYPNPVTTKLTIESNSVIDKIRLYNTIGKEIETLTAVNSSFYTLNVYHLPAGIYTLKVIDKEAVQSIQRIIIQ